MENNNEPFIVSVKHYDTEIIIKKDRSDITSYEFMEMIEKLVFSVGFYEGNLKDYIIEWGEELKK